MTLGFTSHTGSGGPHCQLARCSTADKKVVIGDDGKVKYVRSLWFDDRDTADRFSAAVVEAVMKEKKPAAIDDGLRDFRV